MQQWVLREVVVTPRTTLTHGPSYNVTLWSTHNNTSHALLPWQPAPLWLQQSVETLPTHLYQDDVISIL